MTGTVSIVTGANVGLGYQSALRLAEKGSKVVMCCRSTKRCDAAAAEMKETNAELDLVTMQLDLGSFIAEFLSVSLPSPSPCFL